MSNMNRRTFVRNSALGGAGIFLSKDLLFANSFQTMFSNSLTNGIGGLVPVSIIEDALLLVHRSGKLKGEAKFALTSDLHNRPAAPGNKGRLATILPVLDKKLIELLQILKEKKEINKKVEKIALAFGWICNNEIYKQLKPVYGDKPSQDKIREVQLYHDAELIRQISNLQSTGNLKEEYIASFMNEIQPRTLTRVHTMKPSKDGHEWVNRMADWRKENKSYLDILASIIVNPEPGKKDMYVRKTNFYDPADHVISYVRALQKAKNVTIKKIEAAVSGEEGKSLYARAIINSYNHILATNEFLNDKISERELKSKLL